MKRKAFKLTSVGFERAPQYNFSDDGNYFTGYIYKGVPATYLRYEDEIYLTMRLDYMSHPAGVDMEKAPNDWRYNGINIDEINMDELKKWADEVAKFAKENDFKAEPLYRG